MLALGSKVLALFVLTTTLVLASAVSAAPPPVSDEIGMDDPVYVNGLDGPAEQWDIAWNGTVHLVVWDQLRPDTGYDVLGRRVDESGAVLGAPFVIATGEGHQTAPRVASDGVGFLVVWDSLVGVTHSVRAARVDASGALLDPDGLPIASPAGNPQVEFGGSSYLVAWVALTNPGDLRVGRVDTSGNLLDPGGNVVSTSGGMLGIGWSGADYLVAWSQSVSASQRDVYARRVSEAAVPIDAAPILVSTSAAQKIVGGVASDGTDFLVVWGSNLGYTVAGARVSAAGAVLDALPIGISFTGSRPAVVHDGMDYVVGWGSSSTDVAARRVGSDGLLVDAAPVVVSSATGTQDGAALDMTPSGAMLVWGDTRNNMGRELFGARLAADLSALDANGIQVKSNVLTIANKQDFPAVASNGSIYLAVWEDSRIAGKTGIYGTRVSENGQILDPSGILIGQDGQKPAVVAAGSDFLVAWQGGAEIRATRVTAAGAVLTPGGASLPVFDGEDASDLSISYDGQGFVIAYTHSSVFSPSIEVLCMRVSPALEKLGIDMVVADPAMDPAVVFDGENHLIVYSGGPYPQEAFVFGRRLSPAGVWVDAGGIPIAIDVPDNNDVAVAFDGTRSLVVWRRGSGTASDLYGARITPAGQVLDLPFAISTAPNAQAVPAVVHDGADFLLAWLDKRGGVQFDVHGARVSGSADILDPDGFVISALPGGLDQLPNGAVGAAALSGTAMVTYSRNDKSPVFNNVRARARLLGEVGSGGAGGAGGSGTGGAGGNGNGGSGGVAGGGAGMAGTGGNGTAGSAGDPGGGSGAACTCRAAGETRTSHGSAHGALLLLAGIAAAVRRRPKRG